MTIASTLRRQYGHQASPHKLAGSALSIWILATPAGAHETWFDPAMARERLVEVALQDLGKTARQMNLPPRLWCADAVNLWRKKAGMRVARSTAPGWDAAGNETTKFERSAA